MPPIAQRLLSIEQWGNIAWESMDSAFTFATNMKLNATDAPDLSRVTSASSMFRFASSLTGDFSAWDMSQVRDMNSMFYFSGITDGLSAWDVSHVTDMSYMFFNATSFTGDLGTWNVSNVTNMNNMFFGASSFDHSLNDWNISMVTDFTGFLNFSGMSTYHYDSLLISWASLPDLQSTPDL